MSKREYAIFDECYLLLVMDYDRLLGNHTWIMVAFGDDHTKNLFNVIVQLLVATYLSRIILI